MTSLALYTRTRDCNEVGVGVFLSKRKRNRNRRAGWMEMEMWEERRTKEEDGKERRKERRKERERRVRKRIFTLIDLPRPLPTRPLSSRFPSSGPSSDSSLLLVLSCWVLAVRSGCYCHKNEVS